MQFFSPHDAHRLDVSEFDGFINKPATEQVQAEVVQAELVGFEVVKGFHVIRSVYCQGTKAG